MVVRRELQGGLVRPARGDEQDCRLERCAAAFRAGTTLSRDVPLSWTQFNRISGQGVPDLNSEEISDVLTFTHHFG